MTTTTAPSTITVRILSVASGESLATLAPETLAVRPARFENLYRAHHGAGAEIPDDVSTESQWAGGDDEARAAHEALVPELFDAATRLDAMDTGRPCFVLFEGAGGDGEDVWCRYEALVLFDAATRLDAMDTGRPCFVLFEGAGGDGEDVWCRCEIVEAD